MSDPSDNEEEYFSGDDFSDDEPHGAEPGDGSFISHGSAFESHFSQHTLPKDSPKTSPRSSLPRGLGRLQEEGMVVPAATRNHRTSSSGTAALGRRNTITSTAAPSLAGAIAVQRIHVLCVAGSSAGRVDEEAFQRHTGFRVTQVGDLKQAQDMVLQKENLIRVVSSIVLSNHWLLHGTPFAGPSVKGLALSILFSPWAHSSGRIQFRQPYKAALLRNDLPTRLVIDIAIPY